MCGATEIESAYSRYAGVPFPNYGCGGRRCFYQSDYDREVGLYRTGRRHIGLCGSSTRKTINSLSDALCFSLSDDFFDYAGICRGKGEVRYISWKERRLSNMWVLSVQIRPRCFYWKISRRFYPVLNHRYLLRCRGMYVFLPIRCR